MGGCLRGRSREWGVPANRYKLAFWRYEKGLRLDYGEAAELCSYPEIMNYFNVYYSSR